MTTATMERQPLPYIEVTPLLLNEGSNHFRHARASVFVGVALRHPDAWQQQKDNGQFDVTIAHVPVTAEDGTVTIEERPIRALPAVQHCLVQGARGRGLGGLLGLSAEGVNQLEKAAVIHDAHKAKEVVYMLENGPSWNSYDEAQAMGNSLLESTPGRFTKDVKDVAASVAHESLHDMTAILEKTDDELTELDISKLAMHYLDDYTVEFNWANPAQDGLNDLDARMIKNENNERYKALNEEGRKHFNGETAYQAQRRIGHLVEQRLARLIERNTGRRYNPLDLPVLIDNQIKMQIQANMGRIAANEVRKRYPLRPSYPV